MLVDLLQVIASEGEQKASRALKEAADILSTSPAALQLRSLDPLLCACAVQLYSCTCTDHRSYYLNANHLASC
jgi:hypothetical protein